MISTNKNSDTTSGTEKPKRLIDYIDLLQKAKGLSDQQIAEKLGLKEARNLELLRTGLFIPSMSILANMCLEMSWDISDGLMALSSDRDLDFNLNMGKALEPFQLKNYHDLVNAYDEVKSGNKSFVKLSSNGVEVIIFTEK
jgi:transcriptional regulator with XRE-family HTH domain